MNEIECFLNDDFVEFSGKMAGLHTQLKEKSDTMKKVLEQYKKEKEVLETSAKTLLAAWNTKNKKG